MQKYTKTAIALHWLIALLIIAAFGLGVTMTDIPGLTPTKLKYFSWHKWLGVTVLALGCRTPAVAPDACRAGPACRHLPALANQGCRACCTACCTC